MVLVVLGMVLVVLGHVLVVLRDSTVVLGMVLEDGSGGTWS